MDKQFDGLSLGQIKKAKVGGKDTYDFAVGNHLLRGKVVQLDKPLLCTKKTLGNDEQSVCFEI